MEAGEITEETSIIETEEDMESNVKEIGEVVVVVIHPVTKHITVGHMKYVPTQTLTT